MKGTLPALAALLSLLVACGFRAHDAPDASGLGDGGAASCEDGGSCDGGPLPCSTDMDCDDGVFCNGAERCEPGSTEADESGCVPGRPPCGPAEVCREDGDECALEECLEPDADGDGHAAVACGGNDCDDADPDVHPGAPPVAPSLAWPWNGARTGSLHAAKTTILRPRLAWRASPTCDATYELQMDDSCTTPGFSSCAFPSPEVDAEGLSATEHVPETDLPTPRRFSCTTVALAA